jgi:hypothetical protein
VARYVLNWAGLETTETFYPASLEAAEQAYATLRDEAQNPQTRYIGLFDDKERKMIREFCAINAPVPA